MTADNASWSPLVYGRTRRADRWWRAIPSDVDFEWLKAIVSGTTEGGRGLDEQPRFVLARGDRHVLIGVACMADRVSDTMYSDGVRPLYCFVGWAAPTGSDHDIPLLRDLTEHYRAWAAPVYERWMGADWERHPSRLHEPHQTSPDSAPWEHRPEPPRDTEGGRPIDAMAPSDHVSPRSGSDPTPGGMSIGDRIPGPHVLPPGPVERGGDDGGAYALTGPDTAAHTTEAPEPAACSKRAPMTPLPKTRRGVEGLVRLWPLADGDIPWTAARSAQDEVFVTTGWKRFAHAPLDLADDVVAVDVDVATEMRRRQSSEAATDYRDRRLRSATSDPGHADHDPGRPYVPPDEAPETSDGASSGPPVEGGRWTPGGLKAILRWGRREARHPGAREHRDDTPDDPSHGTQRPIAPPAWRDGRGKARPDE